MCANTSDESPFAPTLIAICHVDSSERRSDCPTWTLRIDRSVDIALTDLEHSVYELHFLIQQEGATLHHDVRHVSAFVPLMRWCDNGSILFPWNRTFVILMLSLCRMRSDGRGRRWGSQSHVVWCEYDTYSKMLVHGIWLWFSSVHRRRSNRFQSLWVWCSWRDVISIFGASFWWLQYISTCNFGDCCIWSIGIREYNFHSVM